MTKVKTIATLTATALVLAVALSGCVLIIDGSAWEDWDADLKIVADWSSTFDDVDLYVSYPDPSDDDDTTNNRGVPTFEGLYDDSSSAGDFGFFLQDADLYPGNREIVDPNNRRSTFTSSGASSVEMTEEGKDGGPEVVLIRRPPFDSTDLTYPNGPESSLGLSSSYIEFAWIGVTEVYVDGEGEDLTGADLTVSIYDNNDSVLAEIQLPEEFSVNLESMSVARIHYFVARNSSGAYNYYVIVPDVRTELSPSSFRSAGSDVVYGDGVIGVRGRAR